MTKFGDDLIAAMSEALEHARGKRKAKAHRIVVKPMDVRAIRTRLKLTQDQMSELLGVSLSGYRKWEQGQRQPQGAARTLLKVMAKEPKSVLRALDAG
ncbi:MAG: helix-turn-helix domain-containing protein [Rhizobiales bacterium]|nr:helix-turn-helix domain-containing protein [Hyphomicrobiales bacterium]